MVVMEKEDFTGAINMQLSSSIPIYEQLANFIRLKVRTNIFKPGDKMIPENDLCELLGISRTTVRQAMEMLVDEGLIIRYRRKGSFIAEPKMKRPINNLYNFSANMRELHATPSSVILNQEIIAAHADLAEILQLPTTHPEVFQLDRLRCADERPVLIERTSIPYYLCPGIEQYDFTTTSLYQVLSQNYALNLYHATETIAAVLLREDEAKLLRCRARDAGYKITRISHLDTGFVYEYTHSITRADMCEFQMELYRTVPGKVNIPDNIQRNITL